jgi:small subunit ribosomal protein S18
MEWTSRPRRPRVNTRMGCAFCKSKTDPDYKKADELQPYVSDRGKIVSRGRSGLCSRHQRRLAQAVKRARYLALLPYTERVER